MRWLKSKDIAGLDIGSSAVKMVKLEQGRDLKLTYAGVVELAPTIRPENRPAAIVGALREHLHLSRGKIRQVVTALPTRAVHIHYLKLPEMPRPELVEAILWEARKILPFPLEEGIWDYLVLREEVERGVRNLEMMLVVAPRGTVSEHLALLEDAGLEPIAVEVNSLALVSAWERTYSGRAGETVALIDLGATATTINIIHQGVLQLTREVAIAGNHFTEAIQQTLGLDFSGAEKLKKEQGFSSGKAGENLPVSRALRPLLDQLLLEIQRSSDYYRAQFRGETIGRLLLTGGSAHLSGLREFFSLNFSLPVEIHQPFNFIRMGESVFLPESPENYSRLTVGLGLALRK